MRLVRATVWILLGVLALVLPSACSLPPPADVIFTGGHFHTLDPASPTAQAVAARGGVLVYVGSATHVERYRGPATQVVDLQGATVVPGLSDSHVHLAGVGAQARMLDLRGVDGIAGLVARLQPRVAEARAGEWIIGRGWIETFWQPARFPTRVDLDAVSPNNPVFLVRVDGHGAVANSRALALAGITPTTEDPFGGEILRDADGTPSGMLLDHAMDLVWTQVAPTSDDELCEQWIAGAAAYAARGWTAVQIPGASWREMQLVERLVEEGRIPLRIYLAVDGPGEAADQLLSGGARGGGVGARFTCRAIKVHYDGALGSGGAALFEPYADRPGSGFVKYEDAALRDLFQRALRAGLQLQTHCIGDRANRNILDLYQEAFSTVPQLERGVADPRWRIEHAQILHPNDLPRFARLGVIASMQPSHAITDLHFAPSRLGVERLSGAYAWRPLLASGATIAGGSDAPVEEGDPVFELYAAMVRQDPRHSSSGPGWHPEHRVAPEDALRMFTSASAFAAFEEDWRGTISEGKVCDLTVFSRDPLTTGEREWLGSRCLMTVIGAKIVYDGRVPGHES
ncbi:MAG: amidohydrolase [Planctomycetota bacterium]